MSLKRFIISVVVVAIAGAAFYGYKQYTRKNENLADVPAVYNVKVTDLIGEFASNDSASTQKYLGKVIEVAGMLKKMEKDDEGFVTIVLGDTIEISSVRCAMDSLSFNEASNLKLFTSVNVKGYFTGYEKDETGMLGSDVKLNRCVFIRNDKRETTKEN